MVCIKTVYDKDRVKRMTSKLSRKQYIISTVLTVVIISMAVVELMAAISSGKTLTWVFFILLCVFSPYPLISTYISARKSYKNALLELHVDKDPMMVLYTFKEKRVDIEIRQGEKVQVNNIMLKDLYDVKLRKEEIDMYLSKDNMFELPFSDIVSGSRDELIGIFIKRGFDIKKR